MGANEHGVCVGNEAVYSKIPFDTRDKALTGLDIVRFVFRILQIRTYFDSFSLALERAKTAKSAVEVIAELVEKYGQGGTCYDPSSNTPSGYDNSFLVVDNEEAWVVETCDRVWVAKQIKGKFRFTFDFEKLFICRRFL
jgi:secernin